MTRRKRTPSPSPTTIASGPRKRRAIELSTEPNEASGIFVIPRSLSTLATQCRALRLEATQLAEKLNNEDPERASNSAIARDNEPNSALTSRSRDTRDASGLITRVGGNNPVGLEGRSLDAVDDANGNAARNDVGGAPATQSDIDLTRAHSALKKLQQTIGEINNPPNESMQNGPTSDPTVEPKSSDGRPLAPRTTHQPVVGNQENQDPSNTNFWKDSSKLVFNPTPFSAESIPGHVTHTVNGASTGPNPRLPSQTIQPQPHSQPEPSFQYQFPPQATAETSDRSPTPSHDLISQLEAAAQGYAQPPAAPPPPPPAHYLYPAPNLHHNHFLPGVQHLPPPPPPPPQSFVGPYAQNNPPSQYIYPPPTPIYPQHQHQPPPMPLNSSNPYQPPNFDLGYHKIKLKQWNLMPSTPLNSEARSSQGDKGSNNNNGTYTRQAKNDVSVAPKASPEATTPRYSFVSAADSNANVSADSNISDQPSSSRSSQRPSDFLENNNSDGMEKAASSKSDSGGKFRNLTKMGFGRYSVGGKVVRERKYDYMTMMGNRVANGVANGNGNGNG
ncbi:MAG: hypothetical protein Q9160_004364 [Pyrenula sp. 1 TL-2023]